MEMVKTIIPDGYTGEHFNEWVREVILKQPPPFEDSHSDSLDWSKVIRQVDIEDEG